jgi:hypothetical protein
MQLQKAIAKMRQIAPNIMQIFKNFPGEYPGPPAAGGSALRPPGGGGEGEREGKGRGRERGSREGRGWHGRGGEREEKGRKGKEHCRIGLMVIRQVSSVIHEIIKMTIGIAKCERRTTLKFDNYHCTLSVG